MDIKSYELSLTQQHQRRPLIVFFTFYSYHAEHSQIFTTLTRFTEDGPYGHLITKKCIILAGKFRWDDQMFFFSERPQNHLKDIAALKGAQFVDNNISDLYSLTSLRVAWIIGTPLLRHVQPEPLNGELRPIRSRTSNENISISRELRFGVIREHYFNRNCVYIYNIKTEMRHAQERSGEIVSWKEPNSPQERDLRILMNKNCSPWDDHPGACVERLIELGEETGFDNLHIEFLCPKMPLIVDNSHKLVQDGWFTTRNLVIDNLNWSYENPYGEVCESHAGDRGLDQHSWSLNERHTDDDRFRIRCSLMLLIGITDRYLENSRWGSIRVLYWKRLEPKTRIRGYYEKRPVVIDCPSLVSMKIFSIVRKKENERAHLPQFHAPQLEKLVLVSLRESERCWNIKRLMNNEWPETLRQVTLSAHHLTEDPPQEVNGVNLPRGSAELSHLCIQRMSPVFLGDPGMRLTELRYLELDITSVRLTTMGSKQYKLAIHIHIDSTHFPSLETLILSVPQRANETHDFGTPVNVEVPESCRKVGMSTMLSLSTVRVNSTKVKLDDGFKPRPRREVFVAFVRDEMDQFVHGEELMAEMGRSLDTCLEFQWEDFDMERKRIQ